MAPVFILDVPSHRFVSCIINIVIYVVIQMLLYVVLYGPRREKTCLLGLANNKCADRPAYPRSLISAFVTRFLKSVIC